MAYTFSNMDKVLFKNNKVGRPGKGRKVKYVQTIIVNGDERNHCAPVIRRTIIHKNF